MLKYVFTLIFLSLALMADTPSPGVIKLKGGTDGTAIGNVSDALKINLASSAVPFWQATQPISAASLPLPSGASTSALQSTTNTILGSPMQNSGGSVTANAGTNLNTSSLALESGGHLASIDSKTPALGQALATGSVPVVLTAAQISTLTPLSSVSVSNFPSSQAVTGPLTDTQLRATAVPVSIGSFSLPTGASTSANQTSQITQETATATSVASIDTKFPAIGPQLAAASMPVTVATDGGDIPVAISGTIPQLPSALGAQVAVDSLSIIPSNQAYFNVIPVQNSLVDTISSATYSQFANPGYDTAGFIITGTWVATLQVEVSGDGISFNQVPFINVNTGAVTNTFTSNLVGMVNTAGFVSIRVHATSYTSGTVNIKYNGSSGSSAVSVMNFPASQVVTGTFWQSTQPVSAASLPLPSGAATSALQSTINTTLGSPFQAGGSIGNTTFASTQSGNWNLQYNPINSAGSETTNTVSTVITLTAPSNAIGFVLQAKDSNTANMRWSIGTTATTSVGQQLQPGRDSGYIPAGANISLVSESGTQEYEIQWVQTH